MQSAKQDCEHASGHSIKLLEQLGFILRVAWHLTFIGIGPGACGAVVAWEKGASPTGEGECPVWGEASPVRVLAGEEASPARVLAGEEKRLARVLEGAAKCPELALAGEGVSLARAPEPPASAPVSPVRVRVGEEPLVGY